MAWTEGFSADGRGRGGVDAVDVRSPLEAREPFPRWDSLSPSIPVGIIFLRRGKEIGDACERAVATRLGSGTDPR
jgi:hypothetical protein